MGIPPLKHVIDQQFTAANFSTVQNFPIAQGTVNPNSYTTAYQVRNGSIIRQIIVEIDYICNAAAIDFFDFYIWFNIGGAQSRPNPNSTNISVIKNQIFHQGGSMQFMQQLTAVGVEVPWVNKWRFVVDVPKNWSQVNENDTIELVWINSTNGANGFLKAKIIYKEIFP